MRIANLRCTNTALMQGTILFLITILLLLNNQLLSNWSDDPGTNTPICTSAGDQKSPVIIRDTNYSIIIWQDERNGDADIYARKLDDQGTALWTENGIPIIRMNGDQIDFAAISDGNGGAIIVWCDKRNGYQGDVYGQRVDGDGQLLWAADGKILGKAPNYQGAPAIALTGDGSAFVLAWLDRRNNPDADEIYCQKFDLDGNPLWNEDVAIAPGDTLPSAPRIIGDETGGAYICWYEVEPIGQTELYGGTGVYLQRLGSDGSSAWSPQRINMIVYPQAQPRMEYLFLNRGLQSDAWVTWSEATTNEYGFLFVSRIDSSSTVLFTETVFEGSRHESVNVTLSRMGLFYILYAGRDEYTWLDLYALADDGTKRWKVVLSNPQAYTPEPIGKALTVLSDESIVTVWQDSVGKAMRIDSSGTYMWNSQVVIADKIESLQATSDGSLMTICAFQRDGDIFAQNINSDGSLGTYSSPFERKTTLAPVSDGGFTSGCSWWDYNNDGFPDLFLTDRKRHNYLYTGDENHTFTTTVIGSDIYGIASSEASTWGDYDNDGDADLFVANSDQANFLYKNQDGSLLQLVPDNIANDGGVSYGCAWGDFDNDGYLDLFVANQNVNFLYQNNGDGTFTRITTGDIATDDQVSLGCAWGDYNNDGWLDLFVANVGRNALYTNNGDSTFSKVSTGDIVTDENYSTGGSWGDYDNDGDLDLFVTNFDNQNNALYRNNGDGTFSKVTTGDVVNDGSFSASSAWGDFDNDGDLDLFVANSKTEKNLLFQNNGDGTFTRLTQGAIANDLANSQACSWADYDNDGDIDLFVANAWAQDNFLYENTGSDNHWVQIKCIGTAANISAIGTKIRVKATINGESVWQMREISSQTGHASQNNPIACFGLGDATTIDSIKVEWPGGLVQGWANPPIDRLLIITEGSNALPVDLSYFNATISDNKVKLSWRTETEENNVGFEVQRCRDGSADGQQSWQAIAFIRGHGTTQAAHEYEFVDDSADAYGTYFYRLKQIDADGSFRYSQPVSVQLTVPASFGSSQNYPNPFNPETTIRFTLPQAGRVTLKIYDLSGREVTTLINAEKPAGTHTITWNSRDQLGRAVASGVYIYRLQFKDQIQSGKMVLMR